MKVIVEEQNQRKNNRDDKQKSNNKIHLIQPYHNGIKYKWLKPIN